MEEVYVERKLEHFRQRSNWDCGVACVAMVLPPAERSLFLRHLDEICREEGFDTSTWTIDLCYLLRRFGVAHSYFTVAPGVHHGHTTHAYYARLLPKDESRIRARFQAAAARNVAVHRSSISAEAIVLHLMHHGPAILLTDANLLACDICKVNKLGVELRSCLPWVSQYVGHYVVLCGYDGRRRRVLYRNPTYSDRVCALSLRSLDDARKSFGTDEDVVLVYDDVRTRRTTGV